MNKLKAIGISIIVLLMVSGLSYFLMDHLFTDESTEDFQEAQFRSYRVPIDLVALGDSLTQGVGDSTHRGGYVPLAAQNLRDHSSVRNVSTRNHGRSGATTTDLLQLLAENETVQADIEQSNMVSITIGGNDVVRTFREVGLNAQIDDFEETLQTFNDNLETIFSEISSLNEEVQIYIFGIYNPYHYYFSDFDELQQIFDVWNQTIEQIANENEHIQFVEIDSLFNPEDMEVASEEDMEEIEDLDDIQDDRHPFLYEDDVFHPNNDGYKLMADALYETISLDLESIGHAP